MLDHRVAPGGELLDQLGLLDLRYVASIRREEQKSEINGRNDICMLMK